MLLQVRELTLSVRVIRSGADEDEAGVYVRFNCIRQLGIVASPARFLPAHFGFSFRLLFFVISCAKAIDALRVECFPFAAPDSCAPPVKIAPSSSYVTAAL